MRYFLDTEFNENGITIQLISLALVREDGAYLYLVGDDTMWNPTDCNEFVVNNVLPNLRQPSRQDGIASFHRTLVRMSAVEMQDTIMDFVKSDGNREIWAYYGDYDWVAFCQLWGPMVSLPKGFPMFCLDLKQECHRLGVQAKELVDSVETHNALDDARWNHHLFMALQSHQPKKQVHDAFVDRVVPRVCDVKPENTEVPDAGG